MKNNSGFLFPIIIISLLLLYPLHTKAQQKDNNVESVEKNKIDGTPTSITFSKSAHWKARQAQEIFKKYLGLNGRGNTLVPGSKTQTKQQTTIDRYNQYYNGIRVEHGGYTVMSKDGLVRFITGNFYQVKPDVPC